MGDNPALWQRLGSEVSRALARIVTAPDMGLDFPVERLACQYLAELRVRGSDPRTLWGFERSLSRLIRDLHLVCVRDVTRPKVIAWRQARSAEGVSNKTVNSELVPLKAALAFALYLGQIKAHPLAGMRALPCTGKHARRKPRALTEAEIPRVLKAAAEIDAEHPRWIPREILVRTLVCTGARWGELTSTTWTDLDVAGSALNLREETTKTAVARQLPLDSILLGSLLSLRQFQARFLGVWPSADARIFLSPWGKVWTRNTANFMKYLEECYARAGIEKVDALGRHATVHGLRHSHASRLARFGVPPAIAQQLTGHRSVQVLLGVYTHLATSDAKNAISLLPPIYPGGTVPAATSDGPTGTVASRLLSDNARDDEGPSSPANHPAFSSMVAPSPESPRSALGNE